MTFRQGNSFSNDRYSKPQSRLNQRIRCDSTDEGCPVMDESGAICGETDTFDVFQEFRKIYEDCIAKLEGTEEGNATLRKLAPFKQLIDDLWEQNAMLVETVEELEQEATCRVANLQDKLNKSCQKIFEFEEDIKSLVNIIQCFCKDGVYYPAGLKLNTLCPASVFGVCKKNCTTFDETNDNGCETCAAENTYKNSPSNVCREIQEKTRIESGFCETGSFTSLLSNCMPANVRSVTDLKSKSFVNKKCSFKSNESQEVDCNCQDCAQPKPISIHCNINKYLFNFAKDPVLESPMCCCDSSCLLNHTNTNDC